MNNLLEDKKNLVLLGIILFLLLALLYFYWVKPLKDEVTASLQEVERLEQTIEQLTAEITAEEKKTEVDGDSYQLIKKLPLSRQVDEFLLSLLEIEIVSQSQIESIAFNNYEGELSDSDRIDGGESESEVAEQEETADEEVHLDKASEDDTADLEEPGNPPVSDVADRLPENVRLITLQLDVISPNFERSQKFLKELEKLERLVRVDSLSFTNPGEMELLEADEADIPINMSVTLTTFYYRQ